MSFQDVSIVLVEGLCFFSFPLSLAELLEKAICGGKDVERERESLDMFRPMLRRMGDKQLLSIVLENKQLQKFVVW